ncbi:hypothetical protein, partial [uncultured Ruminococcus sp.]|uniref:hypothetical protein n=1 Tax=uncultured Ruminococcus sp. TaxID=165186 RepID=UPI0025E1F597
MATITLHKSKFDGFASVLDKLCSNFGNYDSTMSDLKRTAGAVDSSTCNLEDVINDIADSQDSKEEKVKRAKELNNKLSTFVNAAVQHEKDAAAEIKKEKNDFYKKYEYLKPDCEKTLLERIGEWVSSVGKAIAEWIADNIIAIIVAAVIIIAAILIVVFAPAICAIAAVIVAALSALMGIADIVCTIITGMDIGDWAESKGWHVFSQIWKGASFGLMVAGIILPIGAMGTAGKNAAKEALKHPFKSLGGMFKDGFKGIKLGLTGLKDTFLKDGFKAGMKAIGKGLGGTALKILGFDDIKNGVNLTKAFFQGKSFNQIDNMCMKMLGLGGATRLAGDGGKDRYGNLIDINSTDLDNAVSNNNLGFKEGGIFGNDSGSFSQMDFEYNPAAGSDAANALTDLRNGTTTSGGSVYNDMRNDFFTSVKGDEALSKNLMDTTGVDISTIANEKDLSKALENNGFILNTTISNADGKAMVDVVPRWSFKATDGYGNYGAGMRILNQGDVNSRYASRA